MQRHFTGQECSFTLGFRSCFTQFNPNLWKLLKCVFFEWLHTGASFMWLTEPSRGDSEVCKSQANNVLRSWWTGDALHNIIYTKPPLWVTMPTVHPIEQHNETVSIRLFCPSRTHAAQRLLKCKAVDNYVTGAKSVNMTWVWWLCWDVSEEAARLSIPVTALPMCTTKSFPQTSILQHTHTHNTSPHNTNPH